MKSKTIQGLGYHKFLPFSKPLSTSICQYVNQSRYFDHFPICQEANGVSKLSGVTQPLGALRQSATLAPLCSTSATSPPPSPKIFRSVYHFGSQKIFPDTPQFFLNTKKFFPKHLKIFRIYDCPSQLLLYQFHARLPRGPVLLQEETLTNLILFILRVLARKKSFVR